MDTPYLVFCCYARKDKLFLQDIKINLTSLEREGLITLKADIDISPGTEWEPTLMQYLAEAHILLLLISPDFIASDYCFHKEMSRALERHAQGTARVVPVIVRPTNWHRMPFGKLQALPKDATPISTSPDRDTALMSVTTGIRLVVQELKTGTPSQQKAQPGWQPSIQEDTLSTNQQARNTMGANDDPGRPTSQNSGNVYGGQFNNGQFNAPVFTGQGQSIVYTTTHAPDELKEGALALQHGAAALLNRDYASARKQLRVAIDKIDPDQQRKEAAKARYLNTLALLDYERPQDKGTTVMEAMNELLSAAIRLDRCDTYLMTKALIQNPSLSRQAYSPQITSYDRSLLDDMKRCQPDLYQQMSETFGI